MREVGAERLIEAVGGVPGGLAALQRKHARQMSQPSLRPQPFDRLAQKRRRDVEDPHRHRGRPQEAGGVRVAVNVCRGFT